MSGIETKLKKGTDSLVSLLKKADTTDKIKGINYIKEELHKISPFKSEPVDFVKWVSMKDVVANDYNPNNVAPPEMKLLEHSIRADGYTQPIVSWENENGYEVIDGFHRNRVGREIADIKMRIKGYLPLSIVNTKSTKRSNRIAATIRHNRARGKHTVKGMSDIVIELKNRNWKNEKIAKELGLDQDEILRLCQITGLASLFTDRKFSKSWSIEDSEPEEFVKIDDDIGTDENLPFKHLNTEDPNRIFHTYEKWECHKAGFYATTKKGMTSKQGEEVYKNFLSNLDDFEQALKKIIIEWKYSCEHYLTNNTMNRIAYLGQAAVCYAKGIPAVFRGGFNLLTEDQQLAANKLALKYLNKWLIKNNREKVTLDEALSGRQTDIY